MWASVPLAACDSPGVFITGGREREAAMKHGQLWDAGVLGPLPWAWTALRLDAQGPLCVGR